MPADPTIAALFKVIAESIRLQTEANVRTAENIAKFVEAVRELQGQAQEAQEKPARKAPKPGSDPGTSKG